jgi:hypothetical protein
MTWRQFWDRTKEAKRRAQLGVEQVIDGRRRDILHYQEYMEGLKLEVLGEEYIPRLLEGRESDD